MQYYNFTYYELSIYNRFKKKKIDNLIDCEGNLVVLIIDSNRRFTFILIK